MATMELVTADVDARAAEVERQVAHATESAEAMQVATADDADRAGRLLREIKARRSAAEKERKELTGPLVEAKRRIDQKFKDAMAPFDAADKIVRDKLGDYQAEQDRLRREEEARLEAGRQKGERIAREARKGQEAEERAKRGQAQREAREAEEEAAKAKDAGDAAAAEQLAEEARRKAEEAAVAESALASLPDVSLPKAVVQSAPKPQGISTRKRWVVKSIILGALPDEYKIADEKAINAAMRDGIREDGKPPEIPGVVFEQVDGLAVRS